MILSLGFGGRGREEREIEEEVISCCLAYIPSL
jgi:hypothetical protein